MYIIYISHCVVVVIVLSSNALVVPIETLKAAASRPPLSLSERSSPSFWVAETVSLCFLPSFRLPSLGGTPNRTAQQHAAHVGRSKIPRSRVRTCAHVHVHWQPVLCAPYPQNADDRLIPSRICPKCPGKRWVGIMICIKFTFYNVNRTPTYAFQVHQPITASEQLCARAFLRSRKYY